MFHLPARPPDGLSIRARGYLFITALAHTGFGGYCVLRPDLFDGVSYNGIKGSLPLGGHAALMAWGVVLLLTSCLCWFAAVKATENPARWALLASVVVTGCWAGGFVASAVSGHAVPTGPIAWLSLVAKDATMLRQPLRNPFEPVVKKILDDEARTRAS